MASQLTIENSPETIQLMNPHDTYEQKLAVHMLKYLISDKENIAPLHENIRLNSSKNTKKEQKTQKPLYEVERP